MSKSIATVVLGATGYVSGELLRLIAAHPHLELAAAVSDSRSGEHIGAVFPHLAPAYPNVSFAAHGDWLDTVEPGAPVALFSAAPHGASAAIIAAALEAAAAKNLDVHVVDCSADFRYANAADYESVYGIPHGAPQLLAEFSSGLPEFVAEVRTPHVGHPGCFATAAQLAIVPLLRAGVTNADLFVTGITGSTGSGRSPQAGTHHPERHSNLYAYKPLAHRHAPEIELHSAAAAGTRPNVHFVPHSGPFARGIYLTVQAALSPGTDVGALRAAFADTYADAAFVEVVDATPKLKTVVASNRAQVGIEVSEHSVAVTCAIDNLVKGAAGGAVQWMNRLWSLDETAGLLAPAPAWT